MALVVRRYAATAGLDPSKYAGHSLRAGPATAAANREGPPGGTPSPPTGVGSLYGWSARDAISFDFGNLESVALGRAGHACAAIRFNRDARQNLLSP